LKRRAQYKTEEDHRIDPDEIPTEEQLAKRPNSKGLAPTKPCDTFLPREHSKTGLIFKPSLPGWDTKMVVN
jgi:hypothetical protein